jgi:hypothetical protein
MFNRDLNRRGLVAMVCEKNWHAYNSSVDYRIGCHGLSAFNHLESRSAFLKK